MSHVTNKKKIQRNKNNRLRGFNGFNTGTRIHKSKKDYKRIKIWKETN